ncbi:MAG: rare lipoprotein [Verrucomicrobiota bacterium]|jgi:rare lipoprotein A
MNAKTLFHLGLSFALICGNIFAADKPTGQAANAKPDKAAKPQVVLAAWYSVPGNSLAHRRAGKGELTAAHNSLRLGTLVRVTNIQNGKSVIVRITDRGITSRRAKIDICKEAAEQIGIVQVGMARVRLDLLPAVAPGAPPTAKAAPAE